MKFPKLTLPALNIRRTYLIARRDFIGYIKTWGFWLTTFGPFIFIFFIMLGWLVMGKTDPITYAVVLDETGQHGPAIEQKLLRDTEFQQKTTLQQFPRMLVDKADRGRFDELLEQQGVAAAQEFAIKSNPSLAKYMKVPQAQLILLRAPSDDIDELKQYVLGTRAMVVSGGPIELNGFLHIYNRDDELKADYWTTAPNSSDVENLANSYFSSLAQDTYLSVAGLSQNGLRQARISALNVSKFNPEKSVGGKHGQAVTFEDSLPYIVASILSLVLWLTIFTGAYMLLVSMVEEKINKVLEMLLATTRFSEIFVGKLLGVALLTIASLLPWAILGALGFYGILNLGDATVIEGFGKAVDTKMYIFLPVFLLLGYVFYGAMFIALGALAESMQDASTLMTPMVLLMTACIAVVPIGLNFPDSPIVIAGQWFPFSAPFAAIVRLPSDPPLWETLGSALSLILSSVLVIWLSSRLFQHGILSGGAMALLKVWFSRNILRKRPTK